MYDGRAESYSSRTLAGRMLARNETGALVRNRRGSYLRTRKCADGSVGQDARWTAVIVESVRIDGKPRQQHVAWLESITESRIEVDHQRRYCWDSVYERLDQLGNRMSIDERRRIEAAVALKVPRLSRDEHDASIKNCQKSARDCGWRMMEHKPYRPPT